MKLLSIAIPSYNSESYMRHCINSVLTGGEDVEILIIDDGSTDSTPQIADEYQEKYPSIVRAIHQPNSGHGGAVNMGVREAKGYFFKVVDSDDWVDQKAYKKVLRFLKGALKERQPLDMLLCNYVYEKKGAIRKKVIRYNTVLPQDQYFSWEDTKEFAISQYILMHSIIYRTRILKESGLELPTKTFYVDNIFAYGPLPYVKKMYYLDVNFYRYFIGRKDQSVNEKVMLTRLDQQIRVNRIMIDIFAEHEKTFSCEQLAEYMKHYLNINMMITSVLLMRTNKKEDMVRRDEIWEYLKEKSPETYVELADSTLGKFMNTKNIFGKGLTMGGYRFAQKWIGFN